MNSKTGSRLKFKLGVRQKVLLLLMTVLLAALSISGWLALNAEKEATLAEINQRGQDISRFVSKSLAYSVIGYDYHTIDLLLNEITISDEISYAKVVNRKGNTMSESGDSLTGENGDLIIFDQPIMINEEVIGHLHIGLSTKSMISRLEKQKYALIKREAFIILLIAIGEFLALSFLIIRPVSTISESLEKQQNVDGRIEGEIPIVSNDEFGELAKRFNRLRNNLNDANQQLKSRADMADEKLIETNRVLLEQSEELKKMNEEFKKLSITDSLTGLYNRRYFDHLLKTEVHVSIRHGDTNSLILFDIDFFKKINDTYGHDAGDVVLQKVAKAMKSRLRETDLLCRIGGEEFACLCKRADKDSSIQLANDLRKEIEDLTIIIGKREIDITVSSGITTLTRDNVQTHALNLYKYADAALYASKDNGRNRVTHYDDMNTH